MSVEVLDGVMDEPKQSGQAVYNAVPTAQKFHASDDFVRGLMGPLGSGKSVACCMEIIGRAMGQKAFYGNPDYPQGVRRSRWAIIRNTYPMLKSTTIKTWQDWIPNSVAPINWGSPITCRWIQPCEDGTTIDLEVMFLAVDRPEDVDKLLSLELTGGWINEAREISESTLTNLKGRTGRFPAKRDGGFNWSGVIMDTNPPDDDHWWYEKAEVIKPVGWSFFRQPGALIKVGKGGHYKTNPEAENVENHSLGYEYWLRQVPGAKAEWIKVYLEGKYGYVADGKPVYPEFNPLIHISGGPLETYRGLPIILGWDFGLTPACIAAQVTPQGQLRWLREYVGTDIGIRQFAKTVVKPALATEFPGMRIISVGDPAGRDKTQANEVTCMQELAAAGLETIGARTQDPTARREAVSGFLTTLTPQGDPAFLVDPSCTTIIKGFEGGFKYRRVMVPGEARYMDTVDKNKFSHPHEAGQYSALHISKPGGGVEKDKRIVRTTQYAPVSTAAGY